MAQTLDRASVGEVHRNQASQDDRRSKLSSEPKGLDVQGCWSYTWLDVQR